MNSQPGMLMGCANHCGRSAGAGEVWLRVIQPVGETGSLLESWFCGMICLAEWSWAGGKAVRKPAAGGHPLPPTERLHLLGPSEWTPYSDGEWRGAGQR